MTILHEQYVLTQHAREALLTFIGTNVGDHLNTPVPPYKDKSIRHLLEHNASCYFFWLAYFALQRPAGSIKEEGFTTVPEIRSLYMKVDEVVAEFLHKFGSNPDTPIRGVPDAWGPKIATPVQLFTHVVTHEFHHKGQIVMMCRQLGHIPPDTDISLTFHPG